MAPGEPAPAPRSVLVLGGASAVGGAAIQMLRSALPEAVILATASPKHVARIEGLGASKVIDRNSSAIPSDVAAVVPGGVDAILDCVAAAAAADPSVFSSLRSNGPRLYSQVFTGQKVTVPEGVESTVVFGRQIFGAPGGLSAMEALGKLVDQKKYKFPVPTTIVGKGWEAIGTGLKQFETGVSGQKLVVVF